MTAQFITWAPTSKPSHIAFIVYDGEDKWDDVQIVVALTTKWFFWHRMRPYMRINSAWYVAKEI